MKVNPEKHFIHSRKCACICFVCLFVLECIAAAVGFFAILLYFPDKPPTPPSNSANEKRIEYKKAICQIIRYDF